LFELSEVPKTKGTIDVALVFRQFSFIIYHLLISVISMMAYMWLMKYVLLCFFDHG
jgi:hypothetical protein